MVSFFANWRVSSLFLPALGLFQSLSLAPISPPKSHLITQKSYFRTLSLQTNSRKPHGSLNTLDKSRKKKREARHHFKYIKG